MKNIFEFKYLCKIETRNFKTKFNHTRLNQKYTFSNIMINKSLKPDNSMFMFILQYLY